MKKKKKPNILWIILIIIFIILAIYKFTTFEKSIFLNIQNESMIIEKYYIYGTHLNISGTINNVETNNIQNVKFILKNSKKENEYDAIYNVNNKNIEIKTSELINEGIYLENLETSKYYIFVRVNYDNGESKTYTMSSEEKENLEYYTITKKNENKKIELRFNNFKYNQSDIAYVMLNVSKTILPNYVYDISIDPGHGGSDPGATYGTYKEAEIALKYSIELKKELENLGLKVLITRDGTEDTSENSKFNVYSVYDENGRVNLIGNAKVKYNLSIHLNSLDTNTLSGTEIYAPANASLEIAKSFADNIVSIAGTSYSTRNINKAEEGVYVRTYTDEEIKESIESARKNGYEEYNITSSTPYLYMIREVGGIATGAYVDGRNTIYGTNKYYNSKIGVESYLIELGYIINQKDLNNMLNNQSAYIQAIVKTIEEKT